ncbi:MAG: NBR1-Ig-like domain-containing protein [Chloroflexota bacterium]
MFGDILFAEVEVAEDGSEIPQKNNARLDSHVTIPNGSRFAPGERIHKTWAVRNTGTTTWEPGYTLGFVGGHQMDGPDSIPVPTAAPDQVVELSIDLITPPNPDKYISRWRLRSPEGKFFGPTLFVSIIVTPDENTVNLLDYIQGDGQLYEMKYIFETAAGLHIGQQRIQTQSEGSRFYIVKNQEWEELWYDDDFIYRGTDTSPGNGNFYTLMEDNRYGSPWVPRQMAQGNFFRRSPTVVSRRKKDCNVNFQLSGTHITWIRLEAIYSELRLPNTEGEEPTGILVEDVIELAAYNDNDGSPATRPFERYYYAKGLGMVMWEGINVDHRGRSFMIELHPPGSRPNNQREKIPCLDRLIPDNDA